MSEHQPLYPQAITHYLDEQASNPGTSTGISGERAEANMEGAR